MHLQPLPVVFGLDVEGPGFVLEKLDFLLACEHGADGVEELNLVIERNFGVLKLFADLEQAAGNVIVLVAVGVEGSEHALQLDAELEILQNDADDPLHLCGVGFLQEIQEALLLVSGVGQQIQDLVEPPHRQR